MSTKVIEATAKEQVYTQTLKVVPVEELVIQATEKFFKEIMASGYFETSKEKIVCWFEHFVQNVCRSLKSDQDKFETAKYLCLLQCEVFIPTFKEFKDNTQVVLKLLDLEDSLRAILKNVLPKDENVEAFENESQESFFEEENFRVQLEKIEAILQLHLQDLYKAANERNDKIVKHFEEGKKRLLELNKYRQKTTEEIHKRLDVLTEKIAAIAKQQIGLSVQAQEAGTKMAAQVSACVQTCTQVQQLKEK